MITPLPLLLATSLVLVTWIDGRVGGEIWVNGIKVCESNYAKVMCPVYAEGLDAWEGRIVLIPDPGYKVMGLGGYAHSRGDVDPESLDTWVVTLPAGEIGQDRFLSLHADFRETSDYPDPRFSDGFESGDLTRWGQ